MEITKSFNTIHDFFDAVKAGMTQSDLLNHLELYTDKFQKIKTNALLDDIQGEMKATEKEYREKISAVRTRVAMVPILLEYHTIKANLENFRDLTNQNFTVKNTDVRSTKSKKLKEALLHYNFNDLESVKDLQDQQMDDLIAAMTGNSLPYQIAMLNFLGFVKHLSIEHFKTGRALHKGIAEILDTNPRSIRGNLNALTKGSTDRGRYTSYLHEEKVENDYKNLK